MNYLDQLRRDGRLQPCPECGSDENLRAVIMASGKHHAAIVCDNCPDEWSKYDGQRFVTWGPKPGARPARRDGKSTGLLDAIRASTNGPVFCLICLRDERELTTAGTWMEAHHIVEHQNGGTDHPANLQPLCKDCHSLVHWRRRDITPRPASSEEADLVAA